MLLGFQSSRTSNSIIIVILVFQVDSRKERTSALRVANLPFEFFLEKRVKARLRKLSDNCGGRVDQIEREYSIRKANCVISFPSADDAERYVEFFSR